jgi:hypothetical protein
VKAEVREQWVAALRSGEYRKGKGLLHAKGEKRDKFCCLGVLCDLAVKAGAIDPPLPVRIDELPSFYEYGGDYEVLPDAVMDWAGLEDANPAYFIRDQKHSLGTDNDDRDYSLKRIADRIERYL